MAGFVDPFNFANDGWWGLKLDIEHASFVTCVEMDGQMGIFSPGHDEAWVDYDEGLLY